MDARFRLTNAHEEIGFPAAVCTSRNEVVCHGIPSNAVLLAPGDIVNVDVTTCIGGYHGDTSATFVVGGEGAASREALHVRCGHRRRVLVTADGCEILTA